MRRIHDDGGAVAVLVAILLPTVLLAVGALAVDLGSVYVRQSAMAGTAQLAAMAGARQLPDVAEARKSALRVMCAAGNAVAAWPEGTCTYNTDDPVEWKNPRPAGAGSITFYRDFVDDNDETRFVPDPSKIVTSDAEQAVAIRIVLPSTQVNFTFARLFGQESTPVTESATARIGTPLGTGTLPFAVTPDDLKNGRGPGTGGDNRFCVRDTTATSPGRAPRATGAAQRTIPNWSKPGYVPTASSPGLGQLYQNASDRDIVLTTWAIPFWSAFPVPPTLKMVSEDSGQVWTLPVGGGAGVSRITSTIPGGLASGKYFLWVQNASGSSITQSVTLTIRPAPGPVQPCDRPSADRGYLDIRRQAVPDQQADLEKNIKKGVRPTLRTIEWAPGLIDLPIDVTIPAVNGLVCGTPLLTALYTIITIVDDLLNISCVDVETAPGFSQTITDGFLDDAGTDRGRMMRTCTDAPKVTTTPRQFDGSSLFTAAGNQLMTPGVAPGINSGPNLRDAIEDGDPPTRGVIKDKIFSCPRFGLVPIIDPGAWVNGTYPVIGHTYVWLDDGADAFPLWNGDRITAVQGHIVDPNWFIDPVTGERNVDGSTVVGDYLGAELPKEAVLIDQN